MALIRFGSLTPDQPSRSMDGSEEARNCLPDLYSYRPIRKLVADMEPLPDRCLGGGPIRNDAGVIFNYAGTSTDLYERAGSIWTNVGSSYNMIDGDYWDFMLFNNQAIAIGGDNIVQSSTPGTPFADIPGAPIARRGAVVRNFLVTGDIQSDRRLIKWSGLRDETQWTPGINQSGEQVINTGGNITKIVPGEYGVIFTENTIYRMQYVGAPLVFQFDDVTQGKGCISPGSVAQVGFLVYYLSLDGFYVFDGTQTTALGNTTVNKSFFKDYDNSYPRSVTSAVDLENTLVFWAYPSLEAKKGEPDKLIVYNWVTQSFTGPIDIPTQILTYDQTPGVVSDDLSVEAILVDDALTGALLCDASTFKGGEDRVLTAFTDKNEHAAFAGDILQAVIKSSEFAPYEGRRSMLKTIRAIVEGDNPNISVAVESRLKTYGPTTTTADVPTDDHAEAHFRINNRNFKVIVKVDGEFDHIVGFEPFAKRMGDRR